MHASPTCQGAMLLTPQGKTFSARPETRASSALRASCREGVPSTLLRLSITHLYARRLNNNCQPCLARSKTYAVVSRRDVSFLTSVFCPGSGLAGADMSHAPGALSGLSGCDDDPRSRHGPWAGMGTGSWWHGSHLYPRHPSGQTHAN